MLSHIMHTSYSGGLETSAGAVWEEEEEEEESLNLLSTANVVAQILCYCSGAVWADMIV